MAFPPDSAYDTGVNVREPRFPGGPIRTLSVSLLAVAALVAGVLFNRSRQPSPAPSPDIDAGNGDAVQLEALREAGI